MNPYDFVRIDWANEPERRAPTYHDRFQGLSGRIEGRITAEMPIFIPTTETDRQKQYRERFDRPVPFAQNRAEDHIIPGSSLKGLFRNLVETIGPGCWWFMDHHSRNLPWSFKQCPRPHDSDPPQLCVACRLFGLVQGDTLLSGKVGFDDAVCDHVETHDPVYTPILLAPKPRRTAWYLDDDREYVAGRKFYFHFHDIRTETEPISAKEEGYLNQYIEPLGVGSTFTFSAHFTNVAEDEWPVLLYVLVLESDMRHKLGYAKPAGLGSVKIELTKLTLIDPVARYTEPEKGPQEYVGGRLIGYVDSQIAPFVKDRKSVSLTDLRRIWGWPPAAGVTYEYPPWEWFKENPNAPISETP